MVVPMVVAKVAATTRKAVSAAATTVAHTRATKTMAITLTRGPSPRCSLGQLSIVASTVSFPQAHTARPSLDLQCVHAVT